MIRRSILLMAALLAATGIRPASAQELSLNAQEPPTTETQRLLVAMARAGQANAQDPLPTDKAGWIEALTKASQANPPGLRSFMLVNALLLADPELTYQVLHDGWNSIANESERIRLLQPFGAGQGSGCAFNHFNNSYNDEHIRPHLLEIFDLGATDPSPQVRQATFALLNGALCQEIKDEAAYETWRKGIGEQPLDEVTRHACRDLFTQLAKADDAHKPELLDRIFAINFSDGLHTSVSPQGETRGAMAYGLNAVHRNTALSSGLLQTLKSCLQANEPREVSEKTARILLQFHPDDAFLNSVEADFQRVLLSMLQDGKKSSLPQICINIGQLHRPWATDLMLKTLADVYPSENVRYVMSAFMANPDPRCIPTLIALLDAGVETGLQRQISFLLSRLTNARADADVDADWWLDWWEQNKVNFPAEARSLPLPKLKSASGADVAIRRRKKLYRIAEDPHRAYWLFSPGLLLSQPGVKKTGAVPSPAAPPSAPNDRPGLLVALCDDDMEDILVRQHWTDIVHKALEDRYLVAVVVAPRWSPDQKALWVTEKNRALVKDAAFTTETLVSDVVRDVESRFPIDPARVFLHGEGEGGMAAYVCSLQAQTPFQGFYLLASAFRSAQLPALTAAKGRRFYISHSQSDRVTPYFMAVAAQQILSKAGATAKLTPYQGAHGYKFEGDAWEPLIQARKWLESAK